MNEFIIAAENVAKSYQVGLKRVDVLRGLSLHVSRGEMIAITGVSGIGKSTLLHLLGTLDMPTSGTITIAGQDPFVLSPSKLAHFRNQTIGFVFQAHHLLPEFTACENIMIPLLINNYSKKDARKEAERLLEEVGLTERGIHKPGELSGGEQQRVAVARSLVNKPAVILADEPTGNLDEGTGRSILKLLREINKNHLITFVIATHNLGLAAQTDRQLKLSEGLIVSDEKIPGA